jgi:transposase
LIVFEDESGASLRPSVRSTWAPKGKTPVITHHFAWKSLSMAGALAFEADGSYAQLVFEIRPGAYNDEALIDFLSQLHVLLRRRKVVLIWDGLPGHRSRKMTTWISTQRKWLRVERLPGYAHELNPVEPMWGNLKGNELANLCPNTLEELEDAADEGLCRIGSETELCFSFLRHTPLKL